MAPGPERVPLRAAGGVRWPDLGSRGAGLAGFVFLVNLALFDTIRWLSTGNCIFFDDSVKICVDRGDNATDDGFDSYNSTYVEDVGADCCPGSVLLFDLVVMVYAPAFLLVVTIMLGQHHAGEDT